jgi:protein-tyrosine phosphatase
MKWTELHWVSGPWVGKLAVAARPRGGDWLEDELASWHQKGIDEVVSLLTSDEEESLDLKREANMVRQQGMKFVSFPIIDREVPGSQSELTSALEKLNSDLSSGKNVLIHCRQGVGRTGLVAACLLVTKGWDPAKAVEHVSVSRGTAVPETKEQRRWIDHYAAVLAGTE